METLNDFLFNVYPYICLAFFLMGSLARFDRDQYTWKTDKAWANTCRQFSLGLSDGSSHLANFQFKS